MVFFVLFCPFYCALRIDYALESSHWLWRDVSDGDIMFSFIGNLTLRWNASGTPSAWPSLSPYRITPIHWLMARHRLWRNDVVRSYWRTRHPLLRFLCLHEAVTLPFVVAISDPTYLLRSPSALRRLPQWNFVLLAVKCHGISPLSSAVRAIHRSLWPAQISKTICFGFMHAVYGIWM